MREVQSIYLLWFGNIGGYSEGNDTKDGQFVDCKIVIFFSPIQETQSARNVILECEARETKHTTVLQSSQFVIDN